MWPTTIATPRCQPTRRTHVLNKIGDSLEPHISCVVGLMSRPYEAFRRHVRSLSAGAETETEVREAGTVRAQILVTSEPRHRLKHPPTRCRRCCDTRYALQRSCSFTGMTGRTSSIASIPLAAARRSSYAAHRHLWEHHFTAGRCRASGARRRIWDTCPLGPVGSCPRYRSCLEAKFRTHVWTGAGLEKPPEPSTTGWPRAAHRSLDRFVRTEHPAARA
jgi:hypothetical protein